MGVATLGGLMAAAIVVAPAIGAPRDGQAPRQRQPLARGIGSFTPAAGDPRLAATLAAAGIEGSGFRFTPSDARRKGQRAVTVAVRSRSSARGDSTRVAAAAPTVGLTPVAYNLGVAVGWRRFALSGDVARVDLAGMPGSSEKVDLGVSYTGQRASARLQAGADRALARVPSLVAQPPTYSVDLGGSYSLTRNLDVTAGVRYKADRQRLQPVEDNRRDSQAVYVGTAFRF